MIVVDYTAFVVSLGAIIIVYKSVLIREVLFKVYIEPAKREQHQATLDHLLSLGTGYLP